jgi:hypothetical protein
MMSPEVRAMSKVGQTASGSIEPLVASLRGRQAGIIILMPSKSRVAHTRNQHQPRPSSVTHTRTLTLESDG